LKGEVNSIRHNEALQQGLHLIYKIEIDDKTLADACKNRGTLTQALGNELLHVTEIHANRYFLFVDKYYIGIVAVTLHINNLGAVKANKWLSRKELGIFLVL